MLISININKIIIIIFARNALYENFRAKYMLILIIYLKIIDIEIYFSWTGTENSVSVLILYMDLKFEDESILFYVMQIMYRKRKILKLINVKQ